MARISNSASVFIAPVFRQVALSVAATLIATGMVAGLRSEYQAWGTPSASGPLLTSGGKFAARVEALASEADDESPILLPAAHVPLLLAEAAMRPVQAPDATRVAPAAASAARMPVEPTKPSRRIARTEVRRHSADDVAPPRRSDVVAEAATVSAPETPLEAGPARLWSTARRVVGQAAALGGAAWDAINPLGLLP